MYIHCVACKGEARSRTKGMKLKSQFRVKKWLVAVVNCEIEKRK